MCEASLSRRHHPGEALRRETPPQRATSSEGRSADQRFRSMTRARQFQPSDAHCERPEAPCRGLKKERAAVSSTTFTDGDPSLQEGPFRGPILVKKEGPAASLNKKALDVHPRINFIFTKGAPIQVRITLCLRGRQRTREGPGGRVASENWSTSQGRWARKRCARPTVARPWRAALAWSVRRAESDPTEELRNPAHPALGERLAHEEPEPLELDPRMLERLS